MVRKHDKIFIELKSLDTKSPLSAVKRILSQQEILVFPRYLLIHQQSWLINPFVRINTVVPLERVTRTISRLINILEWNSIIRVTFSSFHDALRHIPLREIENLITRVHKQISSGLLTIYRTRSCDLPLTDNSIDVHVQPRTAPKNTFTDTWRNFLHIARSVTSFVSFFLVLSACILYVLVCSCCTQICKTITGNVHDRNRRTY